MAVACGPHLAGWAPEAPNFPDPAGVVYRRRHRHNGPLYRAYRAADGHLSGIFGRRS
jgi:hypothetical protein